MSRHSPSCALCLAILAAACARPAPLPQTGRRPDIELRPETVTIEARVPRYATLESLLRAQQLSAPFVEVAVAAAQSVFDPRRLRSDRPYHLVRTFDGALREFEYQIDADRFLRIISRHRDQPALLDAEVVPYAKRTAVVAVRGRIDADHSSVIAAMEEAGETIQLAMTLAEIFSGEIDFESDLQPGDRFDLHALRWIDPGAGTTAFYDENGRSLKRFFLRSPLRFEPRVTSGFSRSRLHPVFRTYRAHLGIDYGAPAGAAVVSVAAGTVISAGWSGGGGNMVRIRHASGFESYYLHLSAFGKGIRGGVHVDQGRLIGLVGATGAATGPHLDYRLKKNGVFVNPLIEHRKLPPGEPIPPAQLAAFRAQRDQTLQALSTTLAGEGPRHKPDAVPAER